MLFGFKAATERNKTKKRGCARFKMKTAARSKCCQMKQNCGIRSGAVGLTGTKFDKCGAAGYNRYVYSGKYT